MSLDVAAVEIFAAADPDAPNWLLGGAINPGDFVCGWAKGLEPVDKAGVPAEKGLEEGEVFLNNTEGAVLVCLHIKIIC